MDTDKNGKISKEEWMKFMSDEFDRLDANHNGELDPKELLQSRMRCVLWLASDTLAVISRVWAGEEFSRGE
jgi:EF hand domain-containing protein